MEGYFYEKDNYYCYQDTNVLKNKLNIKDYNKLQHAEREITSIKMAEILQTPLQGKFDFNHLKNIHKFIFEDLYEWAGKVRNVNISKGNPFCYHLHINEQSEILFSKLKNDNYLVNLNRLQVVQKLSYYLSEINAIHPFREGNGRAQRIFIEYLALVSGYRLNFSSIKSEEMLQASINSFNCNYTLMESLMDRIMIPISEKERLNCEMNK